MNTVRSRSWNNPSAQKRLPAAASVLQRWMTFRHLILQSMVAAAALIAEPAAAVVGNVVEGRIEGVILNEGKPVQGIRIWSCRDRLPSRSEKACNEFSGTWTDAVGHFSFAMQTGYRPPTLEQCRKPFSCHGDPGWSYWFVLEAANKRVSFWNGGLGYGRTYAQVICDLANLPTQTQGAELECSIVQEDRLEYGR